MCRGTLFHGRAFERPSHWSLALWSWESGLGWAKLLWAASGAVGVSVRPREGRGACRAGREAKGGPPVEGLGHPWWAAALGSAAQQRHLWLSQLFPFLLLLTGTKAKFHV